MTAQKEGHSKQRKEQISEELGIGPVQAEDDGYERGVQHKNEEATHGWMD